mgnify:CR=1 FL=1
MNERIRELIKQATVLEDDELFVREVFDKEKFAKLIIKECVGVCSKENWKTLGIYTKGVKQFDRGVISGRKDMSYELCNKIEEHFGVK